MEKIAKMVASVENAENFKGQYLRNMRDETMWKVMDVGREGLTVYQVEGFGLEPPAHAGETLLTWPLVQAMYAIMVHAGEIETKEVH